MRSTRFCALTAALVVAGLGGCSPARNSVATTATAGGAVLPFVENDWPAALVRARAAQLPLFVEVWAPW